ncbi:uncharacterized protein LOC111353957 [Spodoptera litura]|uniref:Uncharacterized protein LOC111348223 n=1 Tax=Spodoptera litura TaxID=69820 RepID=A0A9J7E1Z2_SPOLT|nr:uncharacterized protein LOC111348223 [Spodoptera litura]XP_022822955.1 uncharacterized protein LOC111353957 [Spodoptera litura]
MEEFGDAMAASEKYEQEISAIALQAKIPHFWRAQPRLWFAQFEAVIAPHKTSDEQKYNLVIPVLERKDIEQISDIICKPPEIGKYNALKKRLLSVYEESESRQFQKLLSGLELGDQKPTQLLRVMRELAGEKVPDNALKILWMGHLPSQVRAVLSVNTEASLDTQAMMADKMMEHTDQTISEVSQVSSIPPTSPSSCQDLQFQVLTKQIEKLTLEIASLRKENASHRRSSHSFRKNNYGSRSRSHSRSRTGKKPGDPDWECYYHHRFGNRAKKCEPPCARKPSEN